MQASREEISNEASEYVQAITRDFQSQLDVARQFGIQARDQLQDLSARFQQVELQRDQALKALGDAKSGFENQMKQMVDRMTVLEQSHGELQAMRLNQRDLLHSKNQLESELGQLRVAIANSNVELLELRGKTKRLIAEVKSKDEMIQSFRTQRESNAQIFPAPSTPPAKPGNWSNVASPSNALVVANEADNGTAQAHSLALLPELRSCTGKDELVVDDLVEKIFNLETPVVPPVVQDPTVTQLSDKVDKLTQVLASVLQSNQSSSKSNRVATPKDDRRGQPPSPPKSSSSSSSSSGNGGGGGKGFGFLGGSRSPSKASEGSSPGGNPSSSSHHHTDPYKSEKKVMRTKAYETLKLPSLPKNAAEARTFKNTIYSMICKLAKTDEGPVFAWISECEKPNASVNDSLPYPLLDRVLGSKLLELSKSTRFSMLFQSLQESSQKIGRQPRGRLLLHTIFEKYKMEKDRGVALTQHHLLSLRVTGNDIKALEEFRTKFDYIYQALDTGERPTDSAMRSLMFEQLKNHPRMALVIDKFRNASSSSSKRTSQWLYEKMVEVIEIHQLEENTQSVDKNLSQMGTKVNAAPNKPDKPGKGDKIPKGDKDSQPKPPKPDKPPKPSKPEKPDKGVAEVDAAAAKGKGKKGDKSKGDKGKGDKGQTPSPRLTPEEKKKRPCMYYAFNSCSKGASCPYLHDDGNKYSGPKPKGLAKKDEPSSSAGAAQVIAGAAIASSIKGAKAQTSAEDSAFKGAVRDAKKWCARFAKDQKKISKGNVFEKAFRAIAALVACCNPMTVDQQGSVLGALGGNQVPGMIGSVTSSNETLDNPCISHEFLLDTGAGRNLISNKGLPDDLRPFVDDAPEKVNFATGGGKRASSKAIKLRGSLSGTNVFYTLKDCPAALSVGLQVNGHQRPFIWLPNQLPFLVKADRAHEITFFCPESAKIYADRVVENVPILAERVSGVDMNSNIPLAPASSSSSSGPSSSPAPGPSDLPRSEEPLRLKDPAVPRFGSGEDELSKIVEPIKEKGDEALDSEDEERNPWSPTLRVKLQEEAKSLGHQLTHFPKNRYCQICRRAKMTQRVHRKRGMLVDPEETPPLHFGHKLRVDHIITGSDLTKGSEGEQACLICYDEYSGCYQAFPHTNRTTDNNIAALQKFGGTRAHGKALCCVKSDAAGELVEAIKYLGWLPEPGIPHDDFHNSKLERGIRSIKEGSRSILLKAGFPHELWPRAVEYLCIAHSFSNLAALHPNESDEVKLEKSLLTCYEAANNGDPFAGWKIPFGALVYYKPPKHRELPSFSARTLPGIFVGWRVDSGFKHRNVHLVLDYDSIRTNAKGYGRPIQVYSTERVEPSNGNYIFPMFEAQVNKLNLFKPTLELPAIERRDALPFEEGAPAPTVRRRRTYVTLERVIKYGKTPGCRGCERVAEGVPHTDECHERFRDLLEKDRAIPPTPMSVPPTPAPAPSTPVPSTPVVPAVVRQDASLSCVHAPGGMSVVKGAVDKENGDNVDFWEYDHERSAWKMNHVRPRKRLYTPVGKNCPFQADQVTSERWTEWKCRGKTSFYKDDWQVSPHQRISSKSWVGSTWFFPKEPIKKESANVSACQANLNSVQDNSKFYPKRCDEFIANLISEFPEDDIKSLVSNATLGVYEVKPPKERRIRKDADRCMFEFCCSPESSLGKVNEQRGIKHFRLTKENSNMSDLQEGESLRLMMAQHPGADLWGSIPCDLWSTWQQVNVAKHGRPFIKRLRLKRKVSRRILKNFIQTAEQTLALGGHIAFEWPRGCHGWKIPELIAFIKRHNLFVAEPDGCAFGLTDSEGVPHLKKWRVVTSCYRLAKGLDAHKCRHPPDFKHSRLEGSKTTKSAFYTPQMCECISQCLYPADVLLMPVEIQTANEHVSTHDLQLEDVYAGIHLLLEKKDWHRHEGSAEAIKKELDGVLANGTWDYSEVIPREDLMKRKEPFNIGRLMTILSVKHWESPSLRKLKARIVFRGDDIRDGDGNLAVLLESKVNPAGISAINANLAFGSLLNNKTTQSDVVRAYLQSTLGTKVPTFVELPSELVPSEHKWIKRPCVRLWKSLYGHPESGYYWDQKFREIMKMMGAKHIDSFPSNFWIPKYKLLLTLYVDDIIVSGEATNHGPFWEELQRYLELDPPCDVERVLGREHHIVRTQSTTKCSFQMREFIDNSCELYEELSGRKLKPAASPFVNDGSLTVNDWESRGSLSHQASRILMKILWCARLCRPDLSKAISDLTRRLTVWSKADDMRLHRLMCYLYGSKEFCLTGVIADPQETLVLACYTDADHCSSQEDTKSSSGMFMCLEGPNSCWPLSWSSRKQSATARSTTEAEMISLGSGLFSEALPMQEFLEQVFDRKVELRCYQDNAAVIQIVEAGYSPKLKHMNKTFRINLGSIYECFKEDEMMKLLYIKTTSQKADPFTKPLPVAKWGEALDLMGVQKVHSEKPDWKRSNHSKFFLEVALAQNVLQICELLQCTTLHRVVHHQFCIQAFSANPKGGEEEFGTIRQSVSPITICCNSKLWLS